MLVKLIPLNSSPRHFLTVLITPPSWTLPQSKHPFLAVTFLGPPYGSSQTAPPVPVYSLSATGWSSTHRANHTTPQLYGFPSATG